MRARSWAIFAFHLACGCIGERGYPCDDDHLCELADAEGRCEPEGWCSYPDDECPGGFRFEPSAGDGLGGQCVDAPTSCEDTPCAAQRIVVGDEHSCVVDLDGHMWCWGSNVFGQLGRDSTAPAERCPAPVVDLVGVELASASEHVCARSEDQRLSCWGRNHIGQVDWHTGVAQNVLAPREILDLASVPAVLDVSPRLSCIASATTTTCWGGVPGVEPPYSVETPAPVMQLATGAHHACARLSDRRVMCVGEDDRGQLGDGEPGAGSLVSPTFPVVEAIEIDAGIDHTCAVLVDDVVCWGANEAGQAGIANAEAVAVPTSVVGLMSGPYARVAAGGSHTCLLAEDGRVQCWGDDSSGQLGSMESGTGAHTVVDAEGEPLVAVEIGAGARHTCARTSGGAVQCWGDNTSLQVGGPDQNTNARHTIEIGCE